MLQSAGRTFAHCAYWLLEQEQTRFGEVRRRRQPFSSSLNGESISAAALADYSADLQVMSELESMFPNDKDASYASPRLASPRPWPSVVAPPQTFLCGCLQSAVCDRKCANLSRIGFVVCGSASAGLLTARNSYACVTRCGRSFRPPSAAQCVL